MDNTLAKMDNFRDILDLSMVYLDEFPKSQTDTIVAIQFRHNI